MSSLPLKGNNSEQRRHVNIVPAVDETEGGCGAVEGFDCYPIALTDGLAACKPVDYIDNHSHSLHVNNDDDDHDSNSLVAMKEHPPHPPPIVVVSSLMSSIIEGGVEQQQGVELQADTIPYPPQGKIGTKKDDENKNENINDDLLLNENGNNHDDDDDDDANNVESPLFLDENDIVTYQEWLPERRNARARRRRGAAVAGCFGLSVETIATKIGRSPIIVSFGTTTTSKSFSSSSSSSPASVCQQQQEDQPQPQLQHRGDLCSAADSHTENNDNNNHQMKQRISTGTLIPTATTIKKNILDFYDESEFTRDSRSSSNSNNNNKPLLSSSSSSSSSPTSTIYHPPPLSPPKTNNGSGGCFDFQMDSILSSIECTLLHKVMCTDEEEEK